MIAEITSATPNAYLAGSTNNAGEANNGDVAGLSAAAAVAAAALLSFVPLFGGRGSVLLFARLKWCCVGRMVIHNFGCRKLITRIIQ